MAMWARMRRGSSGGRDAFQIVLVDPKTMLNVPHPAMPSEQQLGTERFIPLGNMLLSVLHAN